jgi:hypothetical protein
MWWPSVRVCMGISAVIAVGIIAVIVAVLPFVFLLTYFWTGWHPPVGICIGTLAVVGVFVPFFWDKIDARKKAFCICYFLVFLLVEIRSIVDDRKENQSQFENTASALTKIISQATGGTSYIYFAVTEPRGPIEMAPGIAPGYIYATAYNEFVGEFPLHDVVVQPLCPMGGLPRVDYYTLYPSNVMRKAIYLQFPPSIGSPSKPLNETECRLVIDTSNGSYIQVVHFSKQGDKWTWASRLTKDGQPDFKQEFFGPGFPKDQKW